MGPSSGETGVFLRHLVLVILCGWLSGMHIRQSSTQNNSRLINTSILRINCEKSWFYLHDYTEMHGQQNIKNIYSVFYDLARISVGLQNFVLHGSIWTFNWLQLTRVQKILVLYQYTQTTVVLKGGKNWLRTRSLMTADSSHGSNNRNDKVVPLHAER